MKRPGNTPERPDPSPGTPAGFDSVLCWVGLGLVLSVVVFIRFRLLALPFERDEGEFATMGKMILDGILPYREAYNLKPPGIYLAYALLMGIFGESPSGVHAGLLVVNLFSAALVFLLARRLRGTNAGALAAAAFLALSSMPKVVGLNTHATQILMLPALGGLLLLLRLREADARASLLLAASGALMGVSSLVKQPGLFFMLFGLAWIGWLGWMGGRRGRVGRDLLWYLSGAVLPIAVTFLWLASAGVFDRFWFWVVTYALNYGLEVGLREGLNTAWSVGGQVVLQAFAVCALAVVGLFSLGKAPAGQTSFTRDESFFLAAFVAASALAVAMGFHFRAHYFVLLLPAIALLFVAGLERFGALLVKRGRPRGYVAAAATIVGLLAVGQIFVSGSSVYFAATVDRASREIFGANPFVESPEIGERIRRMTSPGDRIAVVGSEPQIYFYADRLPATGYLYTYSVVEHQPFAASMRDEMTGEIEKSRPAVLVYVNSPSSWLLPPEADLSIFSWFRSYREREGYVLAGVVELGDGGAAGSFWGADAARHPGRTENFIEVWKRGG